MFWSKVCDQIYEWCGFVSKGLSLQSEPNWVGSAEASKSSQFKNYYGILKLLKTGPFSNGPTWTRWCFPLFHLLSSIAHASSPFLAFQSLTICGLCLSPISYQFCMTITSHCYLYTSSTSLPEAVPLSHHNFLRSYHLKPKCRVEFGHVWPILSASEF